MRSPYTQDYYPYAQALAEAIGVPCDAIGASGWTTQKMVDHRDRGGDDVCRVRRSGLKQALKKQRYSVVIIMGGTNDLGVADAEAIFSNLKALHEMCHAAGCATVALTIPQGRQLGPHTAGTQLAFANEKRVQVNTRLQAFARALPPERCCFVAMDEEVPWSATSEDFEPDGLHMSAEGYARFGALLAPKVRAFVLGRHQEDGQWCDT